MFRKLFSLPVAMIVFAIMCLIAAISEAANYERYVFANTKSSNTTFTASFFNAKILAVRGVNLMGTGVTNTITVKQVTPEYLTNTIATITTPTSDTSLVESNNFVLLKNDVLQITASTNATVEVVVENMSR